MIATEIALLVADAEVKYSEKNQEQIKGPVDLFYHNFEKWWQFPFNIPSLLLMSEGLTAFVCHCRLVLQQLLLRRQEVISDEDEGAVLSWQQQSKELLTALERRYGVRDNCLGTGWTLSNLES